MPPVRIPGPAGVDYVPVPSNPGQRLATGYDFGSEIGGQIAQAGEALAGLGRVAAGLQKQRQAENDSNGLFGSKLALQDYYWKSSEDAQKNAEPGAANYYNNLSGQWGKDKQRRLSEIQQKYNLSSDAQKKLELYDTQFQQEYGHGAVTFENNENVRWQGEQTGKNLDTIWTGAAAHGGFANAQKQSDEAIKAAGRVFSPEQEAKVRAASDKARDGAFEVWAQNQGAAGFKDANDLNAKTAALDAELNSLGIPQGQKDLYKAKYGQMYAKAYAEGHPTERKQFEPNAGPTSQGETHTKAETFQRGGKTFAGDDPGDDYYNRLGQIESGGNYAAHSPKSSAFGKYQFTKGTAKQYGFGSFMTPREQEAAVRMLTSDNVKGLRKALGRNPTEGELYLAHQQGLGGALALLQRPNELATSVLGYKEVMNNGGAPGMTAGQFAAKWTQKFDGTKPSGGQGFNSGNRPIPIEIQPAPSGPAVIGGPSDPTIGGAIPEANQVRDALQTAQQSAPSPASVGADQSGTPQSGPVMGSDNTDLLDAPKPTSGPFSYMSQSEWEDWGIKGAVAERQQREIKVDNLLVGIHDGTMGEADVQRARQDGWLTDYKDIKKVDKALGVKKEDTSAFDSVLRRMATGNGVYDPTDGSPDRKAIDGIYASHVAPQGLAQGDNSAVSTMYSMWGETGIMPKQAKGEILGMVRSRDTASITTGLSYLDSLDRQRPDAFRREFDDRTETQLAEFRTGLKYNNAQEVADRIKQSNDPDVKRAQESLKKEIKPELDKLTFKDVSKNFEGSLKFWTMGAFGNVEAPFTPDQQAIALEDYKDLVAEQYAKTGDLDKAKQEAAARFSRVWGVSAANGGRVMKHPPENYYGAVDADHPHVWMGDQIRQQLEQSGHATKEQVGSNLGTGFQPSETTLYPQYGLVADDRTDADLSAGRPPSYQLWVVNEDGTHEPDAIGQDGKPRRFVFDEEAAKQQFATGNQHKHDVIQQDRKEISDQLGQIPSLNPDLKIPEGEPLPVNMTTFASTLFGDKSDITEKNFASSDKQTLLDTVKRVQAKTGKSEGIIGYGDYGNGQISDWGTNMSAGNILSQSASNPVFRLETTLGMARYKIGKDGNVTITDVYDWSANKDKVNRGKQATGGALGLMAFGYENRGWEGLLNAVGNMTASKGSGRKVKINLGKID